jgi:hypothetical protein
MEIAPGGEEQTDVDPGPSQAERRRMAERILEVSELSQFVLALRDAVRRQAEDQR